MSRILVMGASRGIGLETVKSLLDAEHEVVAFSRSAETLNLDSPALQKISGDALNHDDVQIATEKVDVVIQTLGVPLNLNLITGPIDLFSTATQTLIPIMQSKGIQRLIAVTGFGAGDSENAIHCLQKIPFDLVFGRAYSDKSIQEKIIKRSGLNWTIIRPGVLTNSSLISGYRIHQNRNNWRNGIVSRAAVADYIRQILDDPASFKTEPVITS